LRLLDELKFAKFLNKEDVVNSRKGLFEINIRCGWGHYLDCLFNMIICARFLPKTLLPKVQNAINTEY